MKKTLLSLFSLVAIVANGQEIAKDTSFSGDGEAYVGSYWDGQEYQRGVVDIIPLS